MSRSPKIQRLAKVQRLETASAGPTPARTDALDRSEPDLAANQVESARAHPLAWRPVALVAAVTAVVHLAVALRFGWHHDEFYYVICGRHPMFGYVDQPPLAPLLARAGDAAAGLLGVRLLAIAAQLGVVWLTAALAARLGGRAPAQALAAASIAASPVFVAGSMLFGTTVLDQLAWAAVFLLVVRALQAARPTRWWAAAGVAAGLGLEAKDTVAVLMLGIGVGLLCYRREVLRTAGPWIALGIAAVLAAPNLIWDALHGWPNVTMDRVLSGQEGGTLGALAKFPALPLLLGGTALIGIWYAGLHRLAAPENREHRWLLPTTGVVVAVFIIGGGKEYYAAPLLIALFAVGAVQLESSARKKLKDPDTDTGRALRRTVQVPVAISFVISLIVGLPILTPSVATALRPINPEPMQTYGWPQFTRQVADAAAQLPADVPIFTSDFGEAGALTILGPAQGIHRPVYSGHDSYTYWGPPAGTPDTVLCVGKFQPAYLHRFWSQVQEVAPITLPDGLKTPETEDHAAIYVCSGPKGTWAQLWPQLRHIE